MSEDTTADKITETTVTIELYVQSVTINQDATTDVLYNRIITDKSDGKIIVRDVVMETEAVAVAKPIIYGTLKKLETPGAANGEQ